MAGRPTNRFSVELLSKQHDRASFNSGVEPLDRYLKTQAGQDSRAHLAAVFVLVSTDGDIAGFYTLSSTALRLSELPDPTIRRLPRYPLVPATLLGRLAVDLRYRGLGHGRFLLADALYRIVSSEIASFAVVADAKNDVARRFYEREGFLSLPDQPLRLFLPVSSIAKLFD